MVEPMDPFEDDEFNRFETPPWSAPMNDVGLVETVDYLGEGVVITVFRRANFGRRLTPKMAVSNPIPQ